MRPVPGMPDSRGQVDGGGLSPGEGVDTVKTRLAVAGGRHGKAGDDSRV